MCNYLEQAEKALKYLAQTEAEYARLKASHQAEDKRRKIVRASCFLDLKDVVGTIAERNQAAEVHTDYGQAVDDWQEAMEAFYLIDVKRKRAELTIEMFRSTNSARKKGNI